MPDDKLRRHIAWEAARLIFGREESAYRRARLKAARRIRGGWIPEHDLPSNGEIRDEIQLFRRMRDGPSRIAPARASQLQVLRVMRLLSSFRPRVLQFRAGEQMSSGPAIEIHVFSDSLGAVAGRLDEEGIKHTLVSAPACDAADSSAPKRIVIGGPIPMAIMVLPQHQGDGAAMDPDRGEPIDWIALPELELALREECSADGEGDSSALVPRMDRFACYAELLAPLADVRQDPRHHPEGDAMQHSLQVFDLACEEMPYEEEFLLAALLHDAGKALDPRDHERAAIEALHGMISEKTAWLIENHSHGLRWLEGTLRQKVRSHLERSGDFELLKVLARCDRAGRRPGVAVSDLEEAIAYLRELARDSTE